MPRLRGIVEATLLAALVLTCPALRAQGHGQGRGEGQGREKARNKDHQAARDIAFSRRDQNLIRHYFLENTSNLPPGLAKRGGNLPPGLEKHLERYGTLPPGLQKRVEPFPARLSRQLPPLPRGYSRVMLGTRALILNTANRILDIMSVR